MGTRRAWLGGVVAAALLLAPPATVAALTADGPADAAAPRASPMPSQAAGVVADEVRVRAELARILARDDLRAVGGGRRSPLASAWFDLSRWIARQPPGVTRGVVAACLVALLLIVAHFAVSLRGALRGQAGRRVLPAVMAPRPSTVELRAAAASAAAAGDHASGVRLLYLAALAALEARGAGDLGRGVADWTVVARCGGRGGPLAELVRRFQESRYGRHVIGPTEYTACLACLDAIAVSDPAATAAHGAA